MQNAKQQPVISSFCFKNRFSTPVEIPVTSVLSPQVLHVWVPDWLPVWHGVPGSAAALPASHMWGPGDSAAATGSLHSAYLQLFTATLQKSEPWTSWLGRTPAWWVLLESHEWWAAPPWRNPRSHHPPGTITLVRKETPEFVEVWF